MKNKYSKTDKPCNIDIVIGWRLLLNLLIFRDRKLKYSKEVKIGIAALLWIDVIGIIIFIWFMVKFFACL